MKPLDNSEFKGTTLEKTARMLASTKVESLGAPLPTRAQERLDRQAAYETTKEEVEKWAPTMKRIREVSSLVLA
jgi:U3 small nucleolar RNA-associated protein 14